MLVLIFILPTNFSGTIPGESEAESSIVNIWKLLDFLQAGTQHQSPK